MTAEEYLEKIAYYDVCIESNRERVRRYKESAENRTSNLSPNKVQTSPSKEKMADAVVSYSDIENRIREYETKKQEIIDTIGALIPNEAIILHKVYVDYKSLKEVASDIGKSYTWVSRVHMSGKNSIQALINKKEKTEG